MAEPGGFAFDVFLKGSATVAERRLHADGPSLPGTRDCPFVHPPDCRPEVARPRKG